MIVPLSTLGFNSCAVLAVGEKKKRKRGLESKGIFFREHVIFEEKWI